MQRPSRQNWPRWARAATSAWVLSPVLVLTLAIGAFAGYGAYTRSKPTHYGRGGDSFALDGTGGASPSATTSARPRGAHKPHVRKGAKPPAGATVQAGGSASNPIATTRPGQAAGGESSSAGHTSTTGGSTPAGSPLPRTGTYTLSVTGQEHVKFGPFSACSNNFPAQQHLVIQHASGEPSGSYDLDQRFYPSSPNKHDERHILRYTDRGVFLSFEQATVTCGGVKQSSAVNYSPVQQRVPAHLSVGARWHNHGGDANRTEDGDSTVVGTTHLTVGGTSYLVYVIDTHLDLSGDETGSREQRWWWSPELAIPLKWHESLSGSRSGATYDEDVTATVVGTP